jgi:hypothetical protein
MGMAEGSARAQNELPAHRFRIQAGCNYATLNHIAPIPGCHGTAQH